MATVRTSRTATLPLQNNTKATLLHATPRFAMPEPNQSIISIRLHRPLLTPILMPIPIDAISTITLVVPPTINQRDNLPLRLCSIPLITITNILTSPTLTPSLGALLLLPLLLLLMCPAIDRRGCWQGIGTRASRRREQPFCVVYGHGDVSPRSRWWIMEGGGDYHGARCCC